MSHASLTRRGPFRRQFAKARPPNGPALLIDFRCKFAGLEANGFPSYQRQAAETLCWARHVVFLTDRGLAENLMPLRKTSHSPRRSMRESRNFGRCDASKQQTGPDG